jgi:hypothetical protein
MRRDLIEAVGPLDQRIFTFKRLSRSLKAIITPPDRTFQSID